MLGELDADGGRGLDLLREFHGLGLQLLGLDEVVGAADIVGLLGGHETAGGHHFDGALVADGAGDAPEAAHVGVKAALGIGDLVASSGRAHDHVAEAGEVEAAAHAGAVDGGDDWDVELVQADEGLGVLDQTEAPALQVECGVGLGGAAGLVIGARTEAAAGPGDDDATHGAIVAGLGEGVVEVGVELGGEGVEAVGAVKGDPEDALALAASVR